MKKIYLSALSLAVVFGSNAQMKTQNNSFKKSLPVVSGVSTAKPVTNNTKAAPLWSNTFATAADWTVGHDATACSLDWTFNTSCQGSYAIADIESTTAADGWAMVDSDFYGGDTGGTEVEDSWITTTNPIADLAGFPNVVVEFESNYRNYNSENTYVVIGIGDGAGNVTWPDLDPNTDISAMNNVFLAHPLIGGGDNTDNPEVRQVNISSALVGLTAVQTADLYLRFHWTGTWGYAWFVDDVNIVEQPADDVKNQGSFVVGTNNEGSEYGRTPLAQLDVTYDVGMQVYNFGINDQDPVTVTADFGVFSSSAVDAILSDSTKTLQNTETLSLTLGVYSGEYMVEASTDILGGEHYGDNTANRTFEVTNSVYSLDGIGVYPTSIVSSTGTGQFTLDQAAGTLYDDNVLVATMYHIKSDMMVASLEVLIDQTETFEGAELYGSIIDTATLMADGTTPLFVADPYTVTAADITAGFVTLGFPGGITLTGNQAYYAAVELVSNGGSAHVRISDDETVEQPAMASALYLPGDQTYSNGVAFAIRLQGSAVGINENTIDGVSVYPNPSKGVITISNDNNTENAIAIFNVLGKEVYNTTSSSNTTVDLSTKGAGVYLVKVSNENGSIVERVVIK